MVKQGIKHRAGRIEVARDQLYRTPPALVSRTGARPNSPIAWLMGFAEPTRLALVRILAPGGNTVAALAVAAKIELANVSHHLGIMKVARVVDVQRDGRFMIYTLLGAKAVSGGIELTHPAGLKLFVPLG